jgi:hypothetical protein
MNTKKIALSIVLLGVALVLPAYSQSWPSVKAQIPFAFVVGDKIMEPGAYTLNRVTQGTFLIKSEDGGDAVFTLTIPLDHGDADAPKLVFNRYGDTYFLYRIVTGWTAGEIPKSRAEREMMAANAAPVTVSLAFAD